MTITRRKLLQSAAQASAALAIPAIADESLVKAVEPKQFFVGFRTHPPALDVTIDGEADPNHESHIEYLQSLTRGESPHRRPTIIAIPSRNTDTSDPLPNYGYYAISTIDDEAEFEELVQVLKGCRPGPIVKA